MVVSGFPHFHHFNYHHLDQNPHHHQHYPHFRLWGLNSNCKKYVLNSLVHDSVCFPTARSPCLPNKHCLQPTTQNCGKIPSKKSRRSCSPYPLLNFCMCAGVGIGILATLEWFELDVGGWFSWFQTLLQETSISQTLERHENHFKFDFTHYNCHSSYIMIWSY